MEKMGRSALLVLHHYNDYANHLVLETAAKMSPDELTRESSPSHGSVSALLLHMVLCEYGFMVRCSGKKIEDTSEDLNGRNIAELQKVFSTVSRMRSAYLEQVSEEELEEVVTTTIMQHPYQLARWQMLLQSLVHSTHHRGELSIVMTALGYPLPTLDIILQIIHDSGQEWIGR